MEQVLFANWTEQAGWKAIIPSGKVTIITSLSGVSCGSANTCFAVGAENWRDPDTPAQEEAIYYWHNQFDWTDSADINDGFALNAVACVSRSQCVSVGQATAGATPTDLLSSFSLTTTGIQAIPVSAPSGATAASLSGIACATTVVCMSVGDATIGGETAPLAETWNGSAWALETVGGTEAKPASLAAVSCPSTSQCVAVGQEQSSVLIERWS
jgi:hypothetical protein